MKLDIARKKTTKNKKPREIQNRADSAIKNNKLHQGKFFMYQD